MKTLSSSLSILALAALTLVGCRDKNVQERNYTANVPVYMSLDEFRSAISCEGSKELSKAGKIFFKDNFLFINNREDGIHVIDNRDPASPVNLSYINIPGNRELAISGNTLYADSYTDLVVIDITDPTAAVELDRKEGVFPQSLPQHDINYRVQQPDPSKGVVIGWELETITEVVENGNIRDGFVDLRVDDEIFMEANNNTELDNRASFGVDQSQVRANISGGKSGSMAGFVLHGDHLYAISGNDIVVFSVGGGSATKLTELETNRRLETLFPFEDNLFVGTTNGMLIYSLSDPANPKYASVFEHAESCDPVAVDGNFAYVTLRSGRNCGGWSDQLDVIDVTDIRNPRLVSTTNMQSPYGLAIDDERLFVCEGFNGMKIFNNADPANLQVVSQFNDHSAMDVITYNGTLMMIGQDGLYQYNFDDLDNLSLLSTITTN